MASPSIDQYIFAEKDKCQLDLELNHANGGTQGLFSPPVTDPHVLISQKTYFKSCLVINNQVGPAVLMDVEQHHLAEKNSTARGEMIGDGGAQWLWPFPKPAQD